MSDNPAREALFGIEHGLALIDSARKALLTVLEEIGAEEPGSTVECIICTLELVNKDGLEYLGLFNDLDLDRLFDAKEAVKE